MGLIDVLLDLYEVHIPREVEKEVVEAGKEKGYVDAFLIEERIKGGRIRVISARVPEDFLELAEKFGVHSAEAKVIYLAREKNGTALLDNGVGRQFARTLGIRVRGTLGLLIEALSKNLIPREEALKKLEELSEVMYLSSEVYKEVLKEILQ